MILFTASSILLVCVLGLSITNYFTKGDKDLKHMLFGVSMAAFVLGMLLLIMSCFAKIAAGHAGIVDSFGSVADDALMPGISIVQPWAAIHQLSIQTQENKELMDIPTKEGMSITVDVSLLYHLDAMAAVEVYKTLGINYEEKIVASQFRSITRSVTASYEAKALYTSARDLLAEKIAEELTVVLKKRGLIVEKVLLRKIILPPTLATAINAKLQAEQAAQQMEFTLQKEKQEAERKRIEAQGISDFQRIVTQGISEPLLKWKGIEATEKLASSTNAKMVIIGSANGLPLILNNP